VTLSNKKIQAVISLLIFLYFGCIVGYLCPTCELRSRLIKPLVQYLLYWGLDQRWCLFAPTFRKWNYHTLATMTFEDGTKTMLIQPGIRLFTVYGRDHGYEDFWPDRARFYGRKLYSPSNKPTSLSLSYLWTDILPPPLQPMNSYPRHTRYSPCLDYRYTLEDFE